MIKLKTIKASIFSILLIIGLTSAQDMSVELFIDNSFKLNFLADPITGYQANFLRFTNPDTSDIPANVENKYELFFSGDSISVLVVQTEDDKFYIDSNLDNKISNSDSFSFDDSAPLKTAIIALKTKLPNIKSIKLSRLPNKDDVLLKRITERYFGLFKIDEKSYPIALYLRPDHFSYKTGGDGIEIAVDIDKNNSMQSDEVTKIKKPIMISNKAKIFTSIKIGKESLVLNYKKSNQEIGFAKNFYHPNIKMNSLDGSEIIELNQYKNKITVINWWSPTCAPCMQEIPELNKLTQDFQNNSNIEFIALNISPDQNKIKEFLKSNDFIFRQFFVNNDVASELGIGAIPRTIVVDRSGKIVFDVIGFNPSQKLESLRETIMKLL